MKRLLIVAALSQQQVTEQLLFSGREAFVNRCSGCHGIEAKGDGPAAPMLNPKPRNLVEGSFKFRSTPSGTLPTLQDLLRTINRGIPNSSMPSFAELPDREKLALAVYIRSLRPEFKDTLKDQLSISLASPPAEKFQNKAAVLKAARNGRKIFEQACMTCHGDKGLGDGPSSEGLVDAESRPIRPANLGATTIKSGSSISDVFRAVSTGLDGTPMPGFGAVFDDATRWDLTAYILTLRAQHAGLYSDKDFP